MLLGSSKCSECSDLGVVVGGIGSMAILNEVVDDFLLVVAERS